MLFNADVVKAVRLEWRRSSDAEKFRLLTVYEVAREFEFSPNLVMRLLLTPVAPWSDNGYGLVELIAELGEAEMGLQRIRVQTVSDKPSRIRAHRQSACG